MDRPDPVPDSVAATRANVQASLLRAPKTGGDYQRTRNWALFVFFRIMSENELAATRERILALHDSAESVAGEMGPQEKLRIDLAHPGVLNAALADPEAEAAPAEAFRNWLKALVSKDAEPMRATLAGFGDAIQAGMTVAAMADGEAEMPLPAGLDASPGVVNASAAVLLDLLRGFMTEAGYARLVERAEERFKTVAADDAAGPVLPPLLFYEFLRAGAPAFEPGRGLPPAIRSEADQKALAGDANNADRMPISFAFTHSGLQALRFDANTLASFPDAFKEGMAARARRLRDTGPSAPEYWEGELGLKSVHGYFTGGFGTHAYPTSEAFWKKLRAEARAFNDATDDAKEQLRELIGVLFRSVGLEIVHIELGQDPHQHEDDQAALLDPTARQTPRTEHFGYRDNLSQPFVDLGLGDTLPGGGTASRLSSWTPVAPGEIFLDQRDEDGEEHALPVHPVLRRGSTFLVFRKLEQDVPGFRSYLGRQRPGDPQAQDALGAQMVGRWKNGASLVAAPWHQPHVDADAEGTLNDFRYAADDPDGRRCPLGAHVRRSNPRDIGGRNDVRRHRILRRGISYGGPLLPENSAGDGEKRGMLFVAANARIDLQFEVIQADWINSGEFLGQAGLDRCPLTGANGGTKADRFFEAGATAPVTDIPRFVYTKGGDYFFLPGIEALKGIAEGETFAVPSNQLPYGGYSMGDAVTPSLYSESRIKTYARTVLATPKRSVRVATPGNGRVVSFVGRHDDVTRILSNRIADDTVEFSVRAYHEASQRITRGSDMLIGTDETGPTCPARHRLNPILDHAWNTLAHHYGQTGGIDAALRDIARVRLDAALRRTAHARRIDLVADIATQAAYGVVTDLFGMPGPSWVTELGLALPFARQHVGDLPADWLAAFKGERTADPGLTTMQVWTAVMVVDLIGNLQNQATLHGLSRQAGSEMLIHIDARLAEVRSRPAAAAGTLVGAFVANEALHEVQDLYKHVPAGEDWRNLYYQDVSMILIEILGSTLAVIPLTFASVMTSLLNLRIALPALPRLDNAAIEALIYEAERLNPNLPVRMRHCEADTDWSRELGIAAGDSVAALVAAANMDPRKFPDPARFSLRRAGIGDAPAREIEDYLLFGVPGSHKDCWGRNRVAMPVLQECIRACSRLTGLRRVAGRAGEPQKLAGVTIGLLARFTRLTP